MCRFCGVHGYPCVAAIVEGPSTRMITCFYAVHRIAVSRRLVPAADLVRQRGV